MYGEHMFAMLSLALLTQGRPMHLTVKDFENNLREARRDGEYARQLESGVRSWFGKGLATGDGVKSDQTTVVWALEATAAPTLVAEDGSFQSKLERIGQSDVYAMVKKLPNGDGFHFHFDVDGKSVGKGFIEVYDDPPESKAIVGVAAGTLTRMPDWHSHVFEGTTREWYVYVPAGLQPNEEAAVMVFQDGQWMKPYVPVVFDNLIAKGEMPKTVGIFLAPGVFGDKKSNRSFEYDTLSDQYARFLLEEILPEVEKTVKLSHDPEERAICGMSSGGICAFTAAWEHPEAFGKVVSWIGSFTNIAHGASMHDGGHNYPALIRVTPKKPIRVFLQDGSNDLDNQWGNWPLANESMAKALAFAGYDYKFVFGKGMHSDKHGRSMLPDTLRWLWRK